MTHGKRAKKSLFMIVALAMMFFSAAPAMAAPAPTAPSNLTATAVSSSQINLAWTDNSSNETGFKIERSTNGVNFTQIATVGANVTTYPSTGLSPSNTYYYRVRAYNAKNSTYSNTASATTLTNPPAAPSDLSTSASSQTVINLNWTDNADNETGYRIERGTSTQSFVQIDTVGANTTSYSATGLSANTTYYFRIKAYNAGGNSAYSNVSSATTLPNPPSAPTNLIGTFYSSTTTPAIYIYWTDNANNETGFIIERGTDGVNFSEIVSQTSTYFLDFDLQLGYTYYYRVKAYNAGGASDFSNIASVYAD